MRIFIQEIERHEYDNLEKHAEEQEQIKEQFKEQDEDKNRKQAKEK